MSTQVYSVLFSILTFLEHRQNYLLHVGGNANYYKSVYHPISTCGNR